jgi:hypothetical protein
VNYSRLAKKFPFGVLWLDKAEEPLKVPYSPFQWFFPNPYVSEKRSKWSGGRSIHFIISDCQHISSDSEGLTKISQGRFFRFLVPQKSE